jgi:teichoic acid transport system ATP-binding protein
MKARLHFAIATSVQPKILMIDEALTVGDAAFKAKSAERVNELLANAGTLLLVSHSAEELRRQCSRVLWIERGLLRADGTPNEILRLYNIFLREQSEGGDQPAEDMAAAGESPVPKSPLDTATTA